MSTSIEAPSLRPHYAPVDLSDDSAFAVRWSVRDYLRLSHAVIILQVRPTSVLYGSDWKSADLFTVDSEHQESQKKLAPVDLSDESAVNWSVRDYLRLGHAVIILQVRLTSVLYGADWGSVDLSIVDTENEKSQKKPLVEAGIASKIHNDMISDELNNSIIISGIPSPKRPLPTGLGIGEVETASCCDVKKERLEIRKRDSFGANMVEEMERRGSPYLEALSDKRGHMGKSEDKDSGELANSSSESLIHKEYELDGIDWTNIDFEDNKDCLDLLEKVVTVPTMDILPANPDTCLVWLTEIGNEVPTSSIHGPPVVDSGYDTDDDLAARLFALEVSRQYKEGQLEEALGVQESGEGGEGNDGPIPEQNVPADAVEVEQRHILLCATFTDAVTEMPAIVNAFSRAVGEVVIVATDDAMKMLNREGIESVVVWTNADRWRLHQEENRNLPDELIDWADHLVVVPLSGNTLAKIALGISDNLVTTVIKEYPFRYIVFPDMQQHVWNSQPNQACVRLLRDCGVQILDEGGPMTRHYLVITDGVLRWIQRLEGGIEG